MLLHGGQFLIEPLGIAEHVVDFSLSGSALFRPPVLARALQRFAQFGNLAAERGALCALRFQFFSGHCEIEAQPFAIRLNPAFDVSAFGARVGGRNRQISAELLDLLLNIITRERKLPFVCCQSVLQLLMLVKNSGKFRIRPQNLFHELISIRRRAPSK